LSAACEGIVNTILFLNYLNQNMLRLTFLPISRRREQ
jgi:hypothetical protein